MIDSHGAATARGDVELEEMDIPEVDIPDEHEETRVCAVVYF